MEEQIMSQRCFVTGANGHLGNNLTRALSDKGFQVRAGVRDLANNEPFQGLACEMVYADLLNKDSLFPALEGVDILYQCAAVFKHWAKDPKMEIVEPNIQMTKNILAVAAEQKVKKVVYISSIVALDHHSIPMDETTWNSDFSNPYFEAKTVSERLAWELAQKYSLQMVSVLPAALIGPHFYGPLANSMRFLDGLIKNQLVSDINFKFNFVDIRDVCEGLISAAQKGKSGERYILGSENDTSTTKVFQIAQSLFPDMNQPELLSKEMLMNFAVQEEEESKTTGQPPRLLKSQVQLYYDADQRLNISKAKKDLGFSPRSPEEAIKETLLYLKNNVPESVCVKEARTKIKPEELKNYGKSFIDMTREIPAHVRNETMQISYQILQKYLSPENLETLTPLIEKERERMMKQNLSSIREKGLSDETYINQQIEWAGTYSALSKIVKKGTLNKIYKELMETAGVKIFSNFFPSTQDLKACEDPFDAFREWYMATMNSEEKAGGHTFKYIENTPEILRVECTYCARNEIYKELAECVNENETLFIIN
jgi:dihydroflavonol-4-reductase